MCKFKFSRIAALLTFGIGVLAVSLWLKTSVSDWQIFSKLETPVLTDEELKRASKKPVYQDKQHKEARQFFTDFQNAVISEDRNKVASMMQYPLRVNFYSDPRAADDRFIKSQDELLEVYEQVFSNSVKIYITKTNPEEIWGNSYFMQTGYGQIGIAVSCNNNNTANECNYDFKIKIIASNTIEIEHRAFLCGDTIECFLKADNEQNKKPQN